MRALRTPLSQLFSGLRGEKLFHEPMARHTSIGVGGPVSLLFLAADEESACEGYRRAAAEGVVFILGEGSNLLVRDGGIDGVMIRLPRRASIDFAGRRVRAGGGVPFPAVAKAAMERGLSGIEFAAGIPGTVGGAVRMNAGCAGEETAARLESVLLLTPSGEQSRLLAREIEFGYRTALLPRGMILEATFHLDPLSRPEVRRKMGELLALRRKSQPLSFPNVGSIFKNPNGDYAGRLIEQAGLKGTARGDAEISRRHGNFIINRGNAAAADVLGLIREAGRAVEEKFGVTLELEVLIVGRD